MSNNNQKINKITIKANKIQINLSITFKILKKKIIKIISL